MRIDTRPRKRNAPRPAEKAALGFLQWLRGRDCAVAHVCILPCYGKIEAAHVDYAGGKGVGTKVADRYAVPLCSEHHYRQHQIGWRLFEAALLSNWNGLESANEYWRQWPGRIAWERKQEANGA